ncbi:hypothetical protein [Natronobacterium texcoconense]|uniref:Uncharacterized protein n=1 Tax=Natronobacterium texcoconense TaxID=1095778 RepID=A0A1H1FW85_NATTX|nr:hypothetical protein [Natronobacterium texcoconense]SDR05263.1 hypothetical protein SAMN04489842_2145 [Natronobacterium texcoconense]
MTETDKLAALFVESSRNTVLSWLLVLVLGGSLFGGILLEQYESVLFSAVAIAIIVAPAIAFRDPTVLPPWYFVGLICLPVLWDAFGPQMATAIVPSLALATLGLLMAVELHRFTPLRLVPWFTVVLTVLFTLAMGGLLNILRWSSDVLFGTAFLLDGRTQDAINAAVMIELIYVTLAGLLAGAIFYAYFHTISGQTDSRTAVPSARQSAEEDVESVALSERLGISTRRQRQLVRAMQIALVVVLAYGLWTLQLPVITNAILALVITFIPAVLNRDFNITVEPGLALWVTSAVFLHAIGTAGLYDAIATWDHLTHTLSATVVAAAGYATLQALHIHGESIHLPRWAMFAFTLVFILAMGVIWEILEFFVDQGALVLGIDPVLAQHGIDDTIVDMMFNVLGAIIVATWGTVYLTEFSDSLATQLEERFDARESDS